MKATGVLDVGCLVTFFKLAGSVYLNVDDIHLLYPQQNNHKKVAEKTTTTTTTKNTFVGRAGSVTLNPDCKTGANELEFPSDYYYATYPMLSN